MGSVLILLRKKNNLSQRWCSGIGLEVVTNSGDLLVLVEESIKLSHAMPMDSAYLCTTVTTITVVRSKSTTRVLLLNGGLKDMLLD